jgi:hypothetical protein
MESMTSRRREFLKLLGFAALTVQIVPMLGCEHGEEPAPPDSLAVTSSRTSKLGEWVAHTHVLYVPLRLFTAPPPEGVSLSTTRTYFHSHQVVLTQDQLAAIARGDEVRVKDQSSAHDYSIRLG